MIDGQKRFNCPKCKKEVNFYEVTVPSLNDKPPGGVVPEQLYREQRMIDLAKAIILNHEKYEIDKKNIDILIDNIMNFVYIGLKKSQDGGDRRALTQSTRTTRQIMEGQQGGGIKSFFRR